MFSARSSELGARGSCSCCPLLLYKDGIVNFLIENWTDSCIKNPNLKRWSNMAQYSFYIAYVVAMAHRQFQNSWLLLLLLRPDIKTWNAIFPLIQKRNDDMGQMNTVHRRLHTSRHTTHSTCIQWDTKLCCMLHFKFTRFDGKISINIARQACFRSATWTAGNCNLEINLWIVWEMQHDFPLKKKMEKSTPWQRITTSNT